VELVDGTAFARRIEIGEAKPTTIVVDVSELALDVCL
jgi:hypothetical protein